jgi:hypothetical protein
MDYAKVVILGGSIIISGWIIGMALQHGLQNGFRDLSVALQAGLAAQMDSILIKEQFRK